MDLNLNHRNLKPIKIHCFYDGSMCKFKSLPILILMIVDEKQTNDNSTQVEFEREIG